MLFSIGEVRGQKGIKYSAPSHLEISVNRKDEILKVNALWENPGSVKPYEDRFYYWLNANEIYITQGGYDGKLLDGPFVRYYSNRSLKEKGNFRNGLKHGNWLKWSTSGILTEYSEWKKGVRSGETRIYNVKGELDSIQKYKNGNLHGKQIKISSDSFQISRYHNGQKKTPREKNSLSKENAPERDKKSIVDRLRRIITPERNSSSKNN